MSWRNGEATHTLTAITNDKNQVCLYGFHVRKTPVYGELILKPLREADSVLGSESANGT